MAGAIPYKGVQRDNERPKFIAHGYVKSKTIFLGRYDSAEEAALVYNEFARRVYGEYAHVNWVEVG
jgi:hypothetical protein